MARTFRFGFAAGFAVTLAVGTAAAQGVAPRHHVPSTALDEPQGTAPGVMPGPMYSSPDTLAPQQRQTPGVSSALHSLYGDPLKKYYQNPTLSGGGNTMDPATRKALRQLYGSKMPLNTGSLPSGPAASGATGSPTQASDPHFRRYDLNGDGVISADEYDAVHMRAAPANPTAGAAAQRRMLMERLGSRFRAADRNHDGRVTPAELDADPNARF